MSYIFPETKYTKNATTKVLLHGDYLDVHILQIAINAASTGKHVWFITPEVFQTLPPGLGYPEKDILKLIRFWYLKDCFDVLKHLNRIHTLMQLPFTLILHKINHYLKDSYQIGGYLICNLIDAINHCSKTSNMPCYLILTCDNVLSVRNIVEKLIHLYIDNVITTDNVGELCTVLNY